jgi:hypothetical protein
VKQTYSFTAKPHHINTWSICLEALYKFATSRFPGLEH